MTSAQTIDVTTDAREALLDAYRAMVPVKDVIAQLKRDWSRDGDAHWSSLATQDMVLNVVIRDPICDEFPPHKSYIYRFLKTYMNEIDLVNAEAHDDLLAELLDFVLHARVGDSALQPDDLYHVSFRIPTVQQPQPQPSNPSNQPQAQPVVITCRVASITNDVGLKIWHAGWYLAEFVVAHAAAFVDKTVVELGAGVGFTGFVLAAVARPRRVVLTDYSPTVLQNLRYNKEVNAKHFSCSVAVSTLDWDALDNDMSTDLLLQADVLLAGDCVYDVVVFPALVRVLRRFLVPPTDASTTAVASAMPQQQRKAIFAATVRNLVTFQTFLDELARYAIAYRDVTTNALAAMGTQLFVYDGREQIRLCELTYAATAAVSSSLDDA